jgi:hypothetical protein
MAKWAPLVERLSQQGHDAVPHLARWEKLDAYSKREYRTITTSVALALLDDIEQRMRAHDFTDDELGPLRDVRDELTGKGE